MIAHIVENMRTKLKLQFDTADMIGDLVGVPIYIILGQIVIVLGELHKSNLVTHFFIKEEAQCISDRIVVVGVHIAVHIHDDRAVAYH